jgi:hypothetical protein
MIFVEFKKAFSSVKRNQIYRVLAVTGISKQLANLTRAILTEWLPFKDMYQNSLYSKGVKQRDALPMIISNLVLNNAMRKSKTIPGVRYYI